MNEEIESVVVPGLADIFPATGETLDYEITGLADNKTEVISTATPDGNDPAPDPIALARQKLQQLRMVRRIIKLGKREIKLQESRKTRTVKGRKLRQRQKASRKANRS